MAAVGSVSIGSKKIDLHAFTGEVISSSQSSETETTRDEDGHVTKHRRWNYNKFVLRAPDGSTQGTEVDTRQATGQAQRLRTITPSVVDKVGNGSLLCWLVSQPQHEAVVVPCRSQGPSRPAA